MATKRSFLGWIGCGCLGLLVLCSGLVGGGYFAITGLLRNSTPYQEAVARAQADSAVQTALGTPVEVGWLLSGSIKESGGSGSADLSIPIHGPNGSARLYVTAHRVGGRWIYDRMFVELPGDSQQASIDLLQEGERGGASEPEPTASGVENL